MSTILAGANSLRREATVRAIVVGLFLAILLGAGNMYLGLRAGLTVSASIPSAMIAMLILRRSPLEVNIAQTIGSCGEGIAGGMIFTLPAFVIASIWTEISNTQSIVIGICGGCLGVLLMVLLRRSLIVEGPPELVFPEGSTCATLIKAGEAGSVGFKKLFGGLGLGALYTLFEKLGVLRGSIGGVAQVGSTGLPFSIGTSPGLISIGYIVGFHVSLLLAIGVAVTWFIAIPLGNAGNWNWSPGPEDPGLMDQAFIFWKWNARFLGVGAMVVSGVWTMFKLFPMIKKAVVSAAKGAAGDDGNINPTAWKLLVGFFSVVTLVTYWVAMGSFVHALAAAVVMGVAGCIFVAVASYIVGIVGSSNSPVSGMTICSLLLAALVVMLIGMTGKAGVAATLYVAGIVCSAACLAGATSQDLKTGHILGASAKAQQWVSLLAVVVSSCVLAPILYLLVKAYGFDTTKGGLSAPQGNLMASLAGGLFGEGKQIPWNMVVYGAGIGIVLAFFDYYTKKIGAKFRVVPMAVAVGLYLPIDTVLIIALGGLIQRVFTGGWEAPEKSPAKLIGAGVIAGEAVLGVCMAIPVLAGVELEKIGGQHFWWLSVIIMVGLALMFFRAEKRTEANEAT